MGQVKRKLREKMNREDESTATLFFSGKPPYKPGDMLNSPIKHDCGVFEFEGVAVVDGTQHLIGHGLPPEGESRVELTIYAPVG